MKVVHLKEYGTSQPVKLSIEQIRALRQFGGKVGLEPSDDENRFLLRANSWIGKFVVPGLTVDIAPKIDLKNTLKMYLLGDGEANPILVESMNRIADENDFWNLVSELLIETVDSIINNGIKREYIEIDCNSDFVRGQLRIVDDMIQNVPIRTGTVCRYTELSPDIPQNQALLWGLETLCHLVPPDISYRIRFMTKRLAEVSLPADAPLCDYKAENDYYRTALFLVKLIKSSLQTCSSTFGLSGFGLMMDMNKVFEGYCRNQIRSVFSESDIYIPDKSSTARNLCEHVKLVPDFLIQEGGRVIAVCDCKYKTNWRFQNADVYQMLAYLEGYSGAKTAMIFHPEDGQRNIVVDKIDLPRSGRLYRVGLPIELLMDESVWYQLQKVICELLNVKPTIPPVSLAS